jgi:tetratricopeptide (TPR) repeat protein
MDKQAMLKLDLEKFIQEYKEGLDVIENSSLERLKSTSAFEATLKILMSRDAIDKIEKELLISSSVFLELLALNSRFDADIEKLRRTANSSYAIKVLKAIPIYERNKWWQSIYPDDRKTRLYVKISDLDWLWKILSIILLATSLCIGVSIVPRFWGTGVTPEGAIGIIGSSALAFITGKDLFEKITKGYGFIERFLKKIPLQIHPLLQQEFSFLISILLLVFMLMWLWNLENLANCYYNRALNYLPDTSLKITNKIREDELFCKVTFLLSGTQNSKSVSQAENDFNRAIKINPDHGLAHLNLGWLNELRQNLKKAEEEYSLAMQNGSLLATSRLASLYLEGDGKIAVSKAAKVMMQGSDKMPSITPEKENKIKEKIKNKLGNSKNIVNDELKDILEYIENFATVRSYWTTLAHVRLQEKRFAEVHEAIRNGLIAHWKIEEVINLLEKNPELNKPLNNTPIFCVYAELLRIEKKKPFKNWLYGSSSEIENASDSEVRPLQDAWRSCYDNAEAGDPDDDFWLTKTWEYSNPSKQR